MIKVFPGYLEWWLGRGLPLSPYLLGYLVFRIRSSLKLKQLQVVPDAAWWSEGERVNSEYTLLHNWMTQWLRYLKWYALCFQDPIPSLEHLLDPPFVTFKYHTDFKDETNQALKAWGLLYRLYDECETRCSPGWMPPTLCGAVISDLEPDSCALSDPSVLSTECDDLYLNVGNHNFIQAACGVKDGQ